MQKKSLFDELCAIIDCPYMSDLTSAAYYPDISKAVCELNLSDYDEDEWIKLAEYVSVNKFHDDDPYKAREYLMRVK